MTKRGFFGVIPVLLALTLAAGHVRAASPNLLTNPTFDSNADGWTNDPLGHASISYTTANADVPHPAGSGLVAYGYYSLLPPPAVTQCVPVLAGAHYHAAAYVFIPTGQATVPHETIVLNWYSGACAGASQGFVGSNEASTAGSWMSLFLDAIVPNGIVNVSFGLQGVVAPGDGGNAQWDDLSFVRVYIHGDADGNGVVDVADVFYLINFLFAGGPPPAVP